MKYQVIENFKAETPDGDVELQPGQVITFETETEVANIESGKVRPLTEVMTEQYQTFMRWLSGYPVTADEIQDHDAALLEAIHREINNMDSSYHSEDYLGFTEALDQAKNSYLEAIKMVSENLKAGE
jgi:hypothetical protein